MKRTCLLFIVFFMLAGCMPLPLFDKPQVETPSAWQVETNLEASIADKSFSEVFPVEELVQFINEALKANSDLRIAAQRVELAKAQYGISRSALFPEIGAGTSVIRQRGPGANPVENELSEAGSAAIAIPAWEIDIWGKIRDQTESAKWNISAQQHLLNGAQISITAQVSQLYLDLLNLDRQLDVTQKTLQSRVYTLKLNRARYQEGVASLIDVRQAESLLASSEQTAADIHRRIAQAEYALSILLGRNPGPVARAIKLDTLQYPQRVTAGLPSDLLTRRPDIIAIEDSLRSANANISVARKAFLPSISLSTAFGFASPDLAKLFSSERYAWSIQPSFNLPIFTAGRLRAGVDIAKAEQEILIEQYKLSIRQAFREVNDALIDIQQSDKQRISNAQIVDANRDRLRIANVRYMEGITNYFEVLDAERQLLESELALSESMKVQHLSLVALYRAVGGGWVRRN